MYKKVSQKIELGTKIIHVNFDHITVVGLFLPKFFASYWYYFNTDFGEESFKQTYPMS